MKKRLPRRPTTESGEFLWLISLSDLMILLFIFFVVMFAFTHKKLKKTDYQEMLAHLSNRKVPPNPAAQIKDKMETWVKEQKLEEQVSVQRDGDTILLQVTDRVFFQSGDYQMGHAGIQVLNSLSHMLEKVPEPFQIGIEGHTDDVPISNKKAKDNWELSTKRALSVLHSLSISTELLKRIVVVGHAEMKPLVPNRDAGGKSIPDNQSKNRRVTFRIF